MTHTTPSLVREHHYLRQTLRAYLSRILALASNRTVGVIVECLAPEFPRLDPATHARVLTDVSTFVVLQVGALPEFLRYPYRLALIAFKWLPVLRWGRSFVALDEAQQRAYLELWAESPLGATRNFVKLIRSCALLAYYDHPAVQGPLNAQVARGPAEPSVPFGSVDVGEGPQQVGALTR